MIFLALILAPVAEELFFRGFIFSSIASRGGFWKGALLSAGIFAIAHIEPITLFPLFVFGIFLSWAYYKTGSIWSSMLAHLLNNALALGVLWI